MINPSVSGFPEPALLSMKSPLAGSCFQRASEDEKLSAGEFNSN